MRGQILLQRALGVRRLALTVQRLGVQRGIGGAAASAAASACKYSEATSL